MAQSENTVTYISPTPPTNMANAYGGTPPTPGGAAFTDDGTAGALNAVVDPTAGNNAEAKGAIVSVTAPGSRAECPTMSISTLGAYTTTPNADHASGKAPASAVPTITGLIPVAPVSGGGTSDLTVNGTNFQPDSFILVAGVPYPTQFNGPTQIKAYNVPKKATAGNLAITVNTGGTATAATNWVFS